MGWSMPGKQNVTITVRGLRMTELKRQEVGQALMNVLNLRLDGETDDVEILFTEVN